MGKVSIAKSICEDVKLTRFLLDSAVALPTKPMLSDAAAMLESLTSLCAQMFFIDASGKWVGCANVWAFVIPKNASKASLGFHLVATNNNIYGNLPSITLPTIDALARLR